MATYLLTWNPVSGFLWDDIANAANRVVAHGVLDSDWSFGNRINATIGERFFLIKQGPSLPKGIVASGTLTSEPYETEHWRDPSRRGSNVGIKFDAILVPGTDEILERELLNSPEFSAMHWDAQSSGTIIPDNVAVELEKLWREVLRENGKLKPALRVMPKNEVLPPQFGEIDGHPEGSEFANRRELFDANLHRQIQAGISGTGANGAYSIVLSGGYEDDEDFGDEIIYTGEGGQEPGSRTQSFDQRLTKGNLALAKNHAEGLPVRVIRGYSHQSPHSPAAGYRYDGLYRVDEYWQERGRSGFQVWRYRLSKLESTEASTHKPPSPTDSRPPERKEVVTLRVVRDTRVTKQVKRLYKHKCQVCGTCIDTPGGPYAEGAHIRPLGRPHNGSDTLDNILCLCPNHHVMFDSLVFTITDEFALVGLGKLLSVHEEHDISAGNLRYHREHFYKDPKQP